MEKYLLIVLFISFSQETFSQARAIVTADELTHPVTLRTFDLEQRTLIHQHFYNPGWLDAKIFKEESAKGFPAMIKFDILNQQVNFLFQNLAMVASSRKINSFTFTKSKKKFIGLVPKNWNRRKVFFESIVEGKYTLLLYHEAIKQKADYHPVLNTGSKDEKIVEKQTYYLLQEGKVFKIPSKKKAAIKLFEEYINVADYVKTHKVNFKQEEDLIKLFGFMNEGT